MWVMFAGKQPLSQQMLTNDHMGGVSEKGANLLRLHGPRDDKCHQ